MCNANRSDEPTQQIESFVLRTFRQSRLTIASAKAKEKQRHTQANAQLLQLCK